MGEQQQNPVVLKAVFFGDDSTASKWWLSLLQQSPGIDLLYIWTKKKETAELLLLSSDVSGVRTPQIVWGDEQTAHGRKNLKTLIQSPDAGCFIIALPSEQHADILETVFSFAEGRRKHIFSCTPPTLHPMRMQQLLQLQQQEQQLLPQQQKQQLKQQLKQQQQQRQQKQHQPHHPQQQHPQEQQQQQQQQIGVWSVCSSFVHEVSCSKTKAILLDLGPLVSAQICCSSFMQNQAVVECCSVSSQLKQQTFTELMRGSCCSILALLRELFGDISSLSGVCSLDSATLAGRLHFEKGPCVSLQLDLHSPVSSFEFTVWGIKGHAKLQWDPERKAFEVQRFLQHYEHPTLHPVTGPTWALKDWARAVVGAEPEEASSLLACSASRFLVNLSVTLSFLQSGGATVDLKVCNEEWQEHTQQISIPPASIAV